MAHKMVKLRTGGMHCPSCSMLIEMNVGDLEGVDSVESDYTTGTTEVAYDPEVVDVERIKEEIRSSGYEAQDGE